DVAFIGQHGAEDHEQGGRLAGAVRTQERDSLTGGDVEVDAGHGRAVTEPLDQPACAENPVHPATLPRTRRRRAGIQSSATGVMVAKPLMKASTSSSSSRFAFVDAQFGVSSACLVSTPIDTLVCTKPRTCPVAHVGTLRLSTEAALRWAARAARCSRNHCTASTADSAKSG